MHVLFVHQNFPAQFRYLAPRLVRDFGWRCSFITERAEGELPGVEKIVYSEKGGAVASNHICSRNFENAVWQASGVYQALKRRPDIEPDLIVAHTGFGSSLFLPFLYDAPIINFLEYFYRPSGQDMGFRPDLPVDEESLLRIKTKNAMILLDVENCDRGWAPTNYQREFFPPELRSKIDVIFDGIDTAIYHRRSNPQRQVASGKFIPPGVRVVTYVARGFEKMRGFDIFMQTAKRIYEQYPNVIFVVVGSDRVHYGSDLSYIKEASFREHVMKGDEYDLSKFIFTGSVSEDSLAEILSISDLHIYLTEPFIASWSMVDAMSCGAVVLASDQRCVREYIKPGENGLLADFFDVEDQARQAVEVLRDPAKYQPLSEAAQRTVAENYSVEVALPRLKTFFETIAAKKREPSVRAAVLVRDGTTKRVASDREANLKRDALRNASTVAPSFQSSAVASSAIVPVLTRPAVAAPTSGSPDPLKVGLIPVLGDQTFRPSAGARKDKEIAAAVERLQQLSKSCLSVNDWIELCREYVGTSAKVADLGWHHDQIDIARLMFRLQQWKPQVIVDASAGLGATLLLWTRVAQGFARLMATGFPGQPLPQDRLPFLESFARDKQRINFVSEVSSAQQLSDSVKSWLEKRSIDFLFLDGNRPFAEVAAMFQALAAHVRPGGLIAWDGLRSRSAMISDADGGQVLWERLKTQFPRQADYLDGVSLPSGGIAMIVLP